MSAVEIADAGEGSVADLAGDRVRALLADLMERSGERLLELLSARRDRQQLFDDGVLPQFPDGDGIAANSREVPAGERDRRSELQVDPTPGALAAGLAADASALVIDLGAALPVAGHALHAHRLLRDTVGASGQRLPPLLFGPRGLEQREPALRWRGEPVPAAFADVVLYLHHNLPALVAAGRAPQLRLSGLQSAAEAALWRDVLQFFEEAGVLAPGQAMVTVGVETVPAVFGIDAIVDALHAHVTALTFDRHACLQSIVHSFRRFPQFVLPDRAELTTATHFLRSWGIALIQAAHRRGLSAIGPCASYLPAEGELAIRVLKRLRNDKERHVRDGFDGSGVAHPALLATAREVFDRLMPGPHQQHRLRADVHVTGADLLQVTKGKITEAGLRHNLAVCLHALLAVEQGRAHLALEGRRETVASAGLAADQLWQWLHLETGILDDGRIIDERLFLPLLDEESARLDTPAGSGRRAALHLRSRVLERAVPGGLFATDG